MRVITILFSLLFIISCEEDVQQCSSEFEADFKNLEVDFERFYQDRSISKSEFLASLRDFKSKHSENSCASVKERELLETADIQVYMDKLEDIIKITPKVVYGDDNRIEVTEISNPVYREYARATAVQFPQSSFGENNKIVSPTLGQRKELCSDVKFQEQLSPGRCSGFLVGGDILVTAGHCIRRQADCDAYKWVFGFDVNSTHTNPDDVYECKEIIEREEFDDTGSDFAVVRLDRRVKGRTPLKFRKSGSINKGDNIFVIGYPNGIPGKFADGAFVRRNGAKHWFEANLDTFKGNSGSAVFNEATGLIEGILVRGANDYILDTVRDCFKIKVCEELGCSGEEVVRITEVDGLDFNFNSDEVINGLFFDRFYDEEKVDERVLWTFNEGTEVIRGAKFLRKCYAVSNDEDLFTNCSSDSTLKEFIEKYL